MKLDNVYINEQIPFYNVLVVNNEGEKLGFMPISEANEIADEIGLDLVLLSANPEKPVCKLMDYKKFKFDQTKKQKENRKKQKEITSKEIRLSLNIDEHDFNTKVKNAHKFIKQNHSVIVVIRLKGRENVFENKAIEVCSRFFENCNEVAKLTKPISSQNGCISFMMSPL